MNGNYWQTGGVEVAFSFGLLGRFPDQPSLGSAVSAFKPEAKNLASGC